MKFIISYSCVETASAQVTELDPSSYLGYKLKHAALHAVHRFDEAIGAFKVMLSKLDCAPDPEIQSKAEPLVGQHEYHEHVLQS